MNPKNLFYAILLYYYIGIKENEKAEEKIQDLFKEDKIALFEIIILLYFQNPI